MKILPNSSFKSIFTKVLIVLVVVLLYFGAVWYYRRTQTEVVNNSNSNVPTIPDSGSQNSTVYKNGTYKATGSYLSPGGTESVAVSLTVSGDKITAATVTAEATVPTSEFFQKDFIDNYKAQVIGKSLADLNLTKVSGSSLTPKGFNDAVAKIRAQAEL